LRGGSWNNNANNVRAAYRNNNHPDNRNNNGFRVVAVRPTTQFVPFPGFQTLRLRSSLARKPSKYFTTGILLPVYACRRVN
jgi:hypothetical protein